MIRETRRPAVPAPFDPAKDAARLLGWFGLAVLMVGAPLTSVLSRRALLIALPVGAAILGSAYALSISADGLRALRRALAAPMGCLALFLAGWAALSLSWTPFPEVAAPRLLATAATALLAAVVIAHLPERRASPTLGLLPAGTAVTAVATGGLALAGPASFRGGTEFDASLVESSAITLVVLVWPALGALGLFGRWRWASALSVLVVATLLAASAQLAAAVFAVAAVAFAAAAGTSSASAHPFSASSSRRTAVLAAAAFAVLVMTAPLLPLALAPLAQAIPAVGRSTVAAMVDWRGLVLGDPARLITGHGLDSAHLGVLAGLLPPHAPRSVLFEVWYDFGVLGAGAFAALFALALLAAGRAADVVAPALVGGLSAVLSVAVLGVATAELWFITLVSLQAVGFGLLARASRGTRPSLEGLQG